MRETTNSFRFSGPHRYQLSSSSSLSLIRGDSDDDGDGDGDDDDDSGGVEEENVEAAHVCPDLLDGDGSSGGGICSGSGSAASSGGASAGTGRRSPARRHITGMSPVLSAAPAATLPAADRPLFTELVFGKGGSRGHCTAYLLLGLNCLGVLLILFGTMPWDHSMGMDDTGMSETQHREEDKLGLMYWEKVGTP